MKTQIICRSNHLKERAIAIIVGLPLDDTHEVIVRPYKSKRSLIQNNLMWKWIDLIRIHIADSTGKFYSGEEIHEWLKKRFLAIKVVEIAGEAHPCTATTTKLNTKEMSDYLDTINNFCASELGLFLPVPGMEQ